ncbi:MAG: hypothetical protein CVU60_14725 [Deltaproteobacteria bacterium HGW-Deltaproteobacteria-18]|jgi:hypothetical protein|nr:MAG: hypothetical protein CVU60_14725 [Deltaproteobacteria bacterium HGW-Deltaproteobacteria-18]
MAAPPFLGVIPVQQGAPWFPDRSKVLRDISHGDKKNVTAGRCPAVTLEGRLIEEKRFYSAMPI